MKRSISIILLGHTYKAHTLQSINQTNEAPIHTLGLTVSPFPRLQERQTKMPYLVLLLSNHVIRQHTDQPQSTHLQQKFTLKVGGWMGAPEFGQIAY